MDNYQLICDFANNFNELSKDDLFRAMLNNGGSYNAVKSRLAYMLRDLRDHSIIRYDPKAERWYPLIMNNKPFDKTNYLFDKIDEQNLEFLSGKVKNLSEEQFKNLTDLIVVSLKNAETNYKLAKLSEKQKKD
ncbi:MAG: hypothetical protein SPG88_13805 [Enterococcus hirae]|nr:hypothetical protein [Methanobrevibacter smithii]MCI6883374.1 hypothetical protein [Lactobacillus johnsonii]MDD7245183.1 hypothetical protein [Methanobrevibacter smithii]MDY5311125.1 hypothetical protein [Enterococcus hirae]